MGAGQSRGLRERNKVLGLIALLAVVQVGAQVRQVAHGFRPFAVEPVRVILSWDMFATRITRCDVGWTPPLPVAGGLPRLTAVHALFEWVPVSDTVETYEAQARAGCLLATPDTRAHVTCVLSDGGQLERAFACP